MRCAIATMLALALCGCHSPSGPSSVGGVSQWSPYVGLHPFEARQNVQQPYVLPLLKNGTVKGIRMDMDTPDAEHFARWVSSNGGDVLAIFPNEHLRKPNVVGILHDQMARNRNIRYWEIGNELDVFTDMRPPEYVPIFLALQEMVEREFPGNVIIPEAPCGGGNGDAEIKAMLDLGILQLANEGKVPVLAIHYYSLASTYLPNVTRQVQRLPASTEVWVTETGMNDASRQVEHVQKQYPRIRAAVRAQRIYWYVFSACDDFEGYALVRGLATSCRLKTPEPSPLYQLLTGGQ